MTVIISVFLSLPIFVISFLFPAMITLVKKNIHSLFFTLPNSTTTSTATTKTAELRFQSISSSSSSSSGSLGLGLGLISATRDPDRPPNVVESAMVKASPASSPSTAASLNRRRSIGFIDEIGGEVDGLMSCTESLGFESSDERRVDNNNLIQQEIERNCDDDDEDEKLKKCVSDDDCWSRSRRRGGEWRKARSFPPPLTSLNRNGEPCFFLRPVRKDGRLELTEVRIHRPQILHASRHDGRLTLHLVPDHSILEEEEDDEEEDEVHREEEEEEEEIVEEEKLEEEVIVEEEEEREEEEEEEEGRYGGEWRLGNEGGLRRCHEMVNHHHHQFHVGHGHGHHLRMCGISIV